MLNARDQTKHQTCPTRLRIIELGHFSYYVLGVFITQFFTFKDDI